MAFGEPIFLLLFLPLVLLAHFVIDRRWRNVLLLVSSLLFYAWGERVFVLVMVASIGVNYVIGMAVDRGRTRGKGRMAVGIGIACNLGLLVAFKYLNFLDRSLGGLVEDLGGSWTELSDVHLPIGISFFTFQAMSYLIDIYRRQAPLQRNPITFALYISLFPQLIAGPIVRYRQIAAELTQRVICLEGFAAGVRRFIIGLAKKLVIADTVGVAADQVFGLANSDLTAGLAWFGLLAYSLQIYFDFSGYSDMAIGLGLMLGFHFPENFLHPYVSRSVTEFWRRWHVSLSSWFRDYLYIPLGGNRRGERRNYCNLAVVFLLCGLWHGAAWSFIVWGAWHGLFLVVERRGLGPWLDGVFAPMRHLYLLAVVMLGWVFFRAETLGQAGHYLLALAGLGSGDGLRYYPALFLDNTTALAMAAGLLGATPWIAAVTRKCGHLLDPDQDLGVRGVLLGMGLRVVTLVALLTALGLSLVQMAEGTVNTFIYFRF